MKRAFSLITVCCIGLAMAACSFASAAEAAPTLAAMAASADPGWTDGVAMAMSLAGGVTAAAPADDEVAATAGSSDAAFVSSTGDERTVNNAVRHAYRVLSDEEKATMQAIKDQGLALLELIDSVGSSRELSIAKTKTEEAVMWAVKHVTA